MAALKYWVWLATLPGLGTRTRLQLLEHFDSPEDIYYADEGELLLTPDITKAQAALLADKSLERAEQVLADCARDGQFILTMGDSLYPNRLRTIFDPPILLYGKGALPMFDDEVAVTVVGTRSCTPYGASAPPPSWAMSSASRERCWCPAWPRASTAKPSRVRSAPAASPPLCWAAEPM